VVRWAWLPGVARLRLRRGAVDDLGQHNGLPWSIVVTTTLADLEGAAGKATPAAARSCPCRI